ncbi:DNA-formamidopyrimidine glycosylase family protein [Glutamicibacter sp. PS]|uniref:Fpg/Nei family DNA glycosylase n=1 Tax=Glutamicibacter sp. PS TaxID=3075634 RepID=UPI00284A32E8|nr:DNA-formamidopyrimidine glycosylase family protein [Glutamicibacter sp. PS]MDR4533915.1 Fpg/Nei family DNA glycosylase [Glutamicibacter sp. PS]
MPEGDSVYRATARLHEALAGNRLRATSFRVPQLATTDLAGYTVHEVVPRGKHLLIRMLPDGGGPGLSLHSHLLMEGRWDLYRPGEHWRKPAHTARVVLETQRTQAVGFDIVQVRLLPTADESEVVGHLGPDLLDPAFDAQRALENLLGTGQRPIGTALLDQRLLAGIGNIYRCETLFLARTHPLCPAAHVGNLPGMVEIARKLLQVNKDRGRRVTTGLARTREPYWVYGRAGRPCLRCGTPIEALTVGDEQSAQERTCYLCPRCQPLP